MARNNDYLAKVDKTIGDKIYSLRLTKSLSRSQLAEVIEVTHQQLQKYEKGVNRIPIGRLMLLSKALGKDIGYFLEKTEENEEEVTITQHQRMCMEVSKNFMKITNLKHQEAVNALVRSLATKGRKYKKTKINR